MTTQFLAMFGTLVFLLLLLLTPGGSRQGRPRTLASLRAGSTPQESTNEPRDERPNQIASSLDDIVEQTFGTQYGSTGQFSSASSSKYNQYLQAKPGNGEHSAAYGENSRTAEQVAAPLHIHDHISDDAPPAEYKPPQEFTYNEDDLSQVDKDLIFEGLKDLYRKKVLPLEIASKYGHFASPPMGPSDFDAKPMVLILGQYSVGKTSFIRSLLQQDFPGQRIGPEPTTDRFTAIMHTEAGPQQHSRLLPGHALVMQTSKPFRGLASYGNNFLSKFEGAEVSAPILRNITIVDTPGVLAGEKQRLGRDYDFSEVVKWFAERADMIIVMFDAHKLDISDELRTVLEVLKPHQPKIRVLLNKADTVDTQALLRVYGALMWALGKVVQTPEVVRVYLGSFWDAPLKMQDNRALLEREKADLLHEMMSLPQNAVVRRINELVKRARSVKVHAYIVHYLKKQMPYVIGRAEKQNKLLDRLDREFVACARRYNLPIGDFPNVDVYRKMLREIKDISDFKRLDKNMVYEMDRVLTHDIPLLLQKATAKSGAAPRGKSGVAGSFFSSGTSSSNNGGGVKAPASAPAPASSRGVSAYLNPTRIFSTGPTSPEPSGTENYVKSAEKYPPQRPQIQQHAPPPPEYYAPAPPPPQQQQQVPPQYGSGGQVYGEYHARSSRGSYRRP